MRSSLMKELEHVRLSFASIVPQLIATSNLKYTKGNNYIQSTKWVACQSMLPWTSHLIIILPASNPSVCGERGKET